MGKDFNQKVSFKESPLDCGEVRQFCFELFLQALNKILIYVERLYP